MALTSVGAIYATASLLLQRIYIPDFDDSEITQQHVGPGETLVNVARSTYMTGGPPAVQAAIGTPTFSGRCAVIDGTNTVIDHVTADPALYTDPRGTVIASDHTLDGDSWNGSAFSRLYIELDHTTGLVVAVGAQPILTAAPTVNALNFLILGSVDPTAVVGASIPFFTAKIVARATGA